MVTLADIRAASERIRPIAQKTPLWRSRSFNEAAGCDVVFKCENLQKGGAFKIRGAANFLLSIPPADRAKGVVAFSSGNHAQAVAIAARLLGMKATIVMPDDAPKSKLEATRANGAEIVIYDRLTGSREAIGRQIAADTGATLVPPFDHDWIIAGAGTCALELLEEDPSLDAIIAPLGGGGLLAGSAVAAKGLNPAIAVYGAEPALADDWHRSLAAGERLEIPPPPTIADGLRTTRPGAANFPIVQSLVSAVLLVSEDELRSTTRFLLSRLKLVVEPSGAAAAAAVLHHKLNHPRIGVILSGGNVDLEVLATL